MDCRSDISNMGISALVMTEITHILAANIRGQFFFVITTTASTRCLGSKFSTNLLFAVSKCHITIQLQW